MICIFYKEEDVAMMMSDLIKLVSCAKLKEEYSWKSNRASTA